MSNQANSANQANTPPTLVEALRNGNMGDTHRAAHNVDFVGEIRAANNLPDDQKAAVIAGLEEYATRVAVEDFKHWVVQPQGIFVQHPQRPPRDDDNTGETPPADPTIKHDDYLKMMDELIQRNKQRDALTLVKLSFDCDFLDVASVLQGGADGMAGLQAYNSHPQLFQAVEQQLLTALQQFNAGNRNWVDLVVGLASDLEQVPNNNGGHGGSLSALIHDVNNLLGFSSGTAMDLDAWRSLYNDLYRKLVWIAFEERVRRVLDLHSAVALSIERGPVWILRGAGLYLCIQALLDIPQPNFFQSMRCHYQILVRSIADVFTPPSTSPPVASLPVGSSLGTSGGDEIIFKGFTANGDVGSETVFSTTGGVHFVTPFDSALQVHQMGDCGRGAPALAAYPGLEERILSNLLLILRKTDVQGIPVVDLMRHLRRSVPGGATVAVVGGAVRDLANLLMQSGGDIDIAILKREINDIDLAVSIPFQVLKHTVVDFFARRGVALTNASFVRQGKHAKFGMMKIYEKLGEADGVDIGVFKAGRRSTQSSILPTKSSPPTGAQPHPSLVADSSDHEYYYGFSYITDAASRDYSINAIYADVFLWEVVDPREGIACLNNGGRDSDPNNPRTGSHRLEFIEKNQRSQPNADPNAQPTPNPEFIKDLGGRVRLFKQLAPKDGIYPYSVPDNAGDICELLASEAVAHNNAVIAAYASDTLDKTPPHPDNISAAEIWFAKVASKLVKSTQDPQVRLTEVLDIINVRLVGGESADALTWFYASRCLAAKVLDHRLFSLKTVDDPNHARLVRVCEVWAGNAFAPPAAPPVPLPTPDNFVMQADSIDAALARLSPAGMSTAS